MQRIQNWICMMCPAPHPGAQEENPTPKTCEADMAAPHHQTQGPGSARHGAGKHSMSWKRVSWGSKCSLKWKEICRNLTSRHLDLHPQPCGAAEPSRRSAPCPGTPGLKSSSYPLRAVQGVLGRKTQYMLQAHRMEHKTQTECNGSTGQASGSLGGAPRA